MTKMKSARRTISAISGLLRILRMSMPISAITSTECGTGQLAADGADAPPS